jgi:hypothetical protein
MRSIRSASVSRAVRADSEARTHIGRRRVGLAARLEAGRRPRAMRDGARSMTRGALRAGYNRYRVRRFLGRVRVEDLAREEERERGGRVPTRARDLFLSPLSSLQLLFVLLTRLSFAEPGLCLRSSTSPYLSLQRKAQPSIILGLPYTIRNTSRVQSWGRFT